MIQKVTVSRLAFRACTPLRFHSRFISFPTGSCQLDRLAVDPDQRRRGFGQVIAEHGVSRARRAGATRVWVQLSPKLQAADSLFRGLGFRDAGRFLARYWGEEMELLELAL